MEEVNIIFSSFAFSTLQEYNCSLVHFLYKAQEGTGLLHLSDEEETQVQKWVSLGFIFRVKRIQESSGTIHDTSHTYILNPEHIWKGSRESRSVLSIDDGTVKFLRPWLPIIDFLKAHPE